MKDINKSQKRETSLPNGWLTKASPWIIWTHRGLEGETAKRGYYVSKDRTVGNHGHGWETRGLSVCLEKRLSWGKSWGQIMDSFACWVDECEPHCADSGEPWMVSELGSRCHTVTWQ